MPITHCTDLNWAVIDSDTLSPARSTELGGSTGAIAEMAR
jgi:hypothetical protein